MNTPTPHEAGRTTRWHASPYIRSQTLADHHGQCVGLLLRLYPSLPSWGLIYEIAHHDIGEAVVGDTPGPAKRRWPDLAEALERREMEVRHEMGAGRIELTDLETRWLKFIDRLEAWLHAGKPDTGEWEGEGLRLSLEAEELGCLEKMRWEVGA